MISSSDIHRNVIADGRLIQFNSNSSGCLTSPGQYENSTGAQRDLERRELNRSGQWPWTLFARGAIDDSPVFRLGTSIPPVGLDSENLLQNGWVSG